MKMFFMFIGILSLGLISIYCLKRPVDKTMPRVSSTRLVTNARVNDPLPSVGSITATNPPQRERPLPVKMDLDQQIREIDAEFASWGGVQVLNEDHLSQTDRTELLQLLKEWQLLKSQKLQAQLQTIRNEVPQ